MQHSEKHWLRLLAPVLYTALQSCLLHKVSGSMKTWSRVCSSKQDYPSGRLKRLTELNYETPSLGLWTPSPTFSHPSKSNLSSFPLTSISTSRALDWLPSDTFNLELSRCMMKSPCYRMEEWVRSSHCKLWMMMLNVRVLAIALALLFVMRKRRACPGRVLLFIPR